MLLCVNLIIIFIHGSTISSFKYVKENMYTNRDTSWLNESGNELLIWSRMITAHFIQALLL